jgi:nucleotide-binding universal stress UspA family protein
MSIVAWIIAPLWVISGIIIYRMYSKKRAISTADEIQILEEEEAPAGEEYRIMVAVAHPKNAIEMVKTTYKLSAAKNARIELIHMVPVPEQVPLTAAKDYMWEGKEAIVESMMYLEPLFPISSTIRYCRNISRGIVTAAKEKKINMLITGWHGYRRSRNFIFGSTIDPIMERSPCNVLVLKGGKDIAYKKILLPLAGGPNGPFAFEIASLLCDVEGEITLFYVQNIESLKRKFDIQLFMDENVKKTNLSSDKLKIKVVDDEDTVGAVLKEVKDHDLLILGATRKPLLAQLGKVSIPDIISRKCEKPVIMAHSASGFQSWIKRLI